jgi:hypothetical protein
MAETSVPKALEGLTVSKTKELKGVSTCIFSSGTATIANCFAG